jgi:hypothetical protein
VINITLAVSVIWYDRVVEDEELEFNQQGTPATIQLVGLALFIVAALTTVVAALLFR